jgi:hypothetical protein
MRGSRPIPSETSLDVGPGQLAQMRHLVDETDLGGEKGIGAVLDQLGADAVAEQAGGVGTAEQCGHPADRGGILTAHHDPTGSAEVFECRSLAEELRKHDEGEVVTWTAPLQGAGRPGRDRALDRDHRPRSGEPDGLVDRLVHLGQVGLPVVGGRGAHGDDDDPGTGHPLGHRLHGPEPPRSDHGLEQHVQPRLVDGRAPGRNRRPALRVDLHDADLATQLSEAGGGHQAHVTGTDHADHAVIGLLCHQSKQ